MTREFDGKVAFITGAAHGQGRVTALALAAAGAKIVGFDVGRDIESVGYRMASGDVLARLDEDVKAAGT